MESLNGKLRDELFNTLTEAKVLIEGWRRHYNTVRPHSSLRYRPPAPETVLMHLERSPAGQSVSASAQPLPMHHEHLTRSTSWSLVSRSGENLPH